MRGLRVSAVWVLARGCLLLGAAAATETTVSVDLKGSWGDTSLFLEACDFLGARGQPGWVERLVEAAAGLDGRATQREQYELVVRTVEQYQGDAQMLLPSMQLHLASRESSPKLEMVQLALRALLKGSGPGLECGVLVEGTLHTTPAAVDSSLAAAGRSGGGSSAGVQDYDLRVIAGEDAAPASAILVGNPAEAPQCVRPLHDHLRQLAADGKVQYFFRPVSLSRGRGVQPPVYLQGYSVELQIKNMEYQNLDDRKVEDPGAQLVGEESVDPEADDIDVAGFDFKRLADRRPHLRDELRQLRQTLLAQLTEQEDADDLSVWRIKDLGLQGCTRAKQARDPLNVLREMANNLPVWAPSLMRKTVPRELRQEVATNQRTAGSGASVATINGLTVTDWSAGALVALVAREDTAVSALKASGLARTDARRLLSLPAAAAAGSGRLDVRPLADGRIWLNDLESDPMYKSHMWHRSVSAMLKDTHGAIPYIAQNLYTMTVVVDPIDPDGVQLVASTLPSLVSQGAPVRFGVVMVPDMAGGGDPAAAAEQPHGAGGEDGVRAALAAFAAVAEGGPGTPAAARELDRALICSDDGGTTPATDLGVDCSGAPATTTKGNADDDASDAPPPLPKSASVRACAAVQYLSEKYPDRVETFFTKLYQKTSRRASLKQVTSAFTASLPSRHGGDPKDTLRSLLRDATFTGRCRAAGRAASRLGLVGGGAARAFLNGMEVPGSPPAVHMLIHLLRTEEEHVKPLVASGALTDGPGKEDAIFDAAASDIVRRLNPRITGTCSFAVAPPPADAATAYFLAHSPGVDALRDATMTIAADLGSAAGLRIAAQAAALARTSLAFRSVRIRLLHTGDCAAGTGSSTLAAGDDGCGLDRFLGSLASAAAADHAPQSVGGRMVVGGDPGLLALHRLLRVLALCNDAEGGDGDCAAAVPRAAALLTQVEDVEMAVVAVAAGQPPAVDAAVARARAARQWVRASGGLVGDDGCTVAVNGRVWGLADCATEPADLELMVETVCKGPLMEAVVEGVERSFPGRQVTSDAVEGTAAAVMKARGCGGDESSVRVDVAAGLTGDHVMIDWEATPAAAGLQVVAVADPFSGEGRRLLSALALLRDHFGIGGKLYLNPALDLTELPLEAFYRDILAGTPSFQNDGSVVAEKGLFSNLPVHYVLTMKVHSPESWFVEAAEAKHDLDNIRLEKDGNVRATYQLSEVVITGSVEAGRHSPKGLQLILLTDDSETGREVRYTDTLVMDNLNYFQLRAAPGTYRLRIAAGRASEVFRIANTDEEISVRVDSLQGAVVDLPASKRAGMESVELLASSADWSDDGADAGILSSLSSALFGGAKEGEGELHDDDMIHVFSLASGHLYERLLKIMMLSVVRKTKAPVKFWLLRNFLSPKFKQVLPILANEYGFRFELVTYHWPSWLHQQTTRQRIIWGLKILFLDVLFPIHLKKIIYIDADQTMLSDVQELWDMNLRGRPYAYTPMCDSNELTQGYAFWRQGFWVNHLRGRPYHISALYVVDLQRFRRMGAGDQLRILYDQLSKDPNSLANLDQDLPNYAQHMIPIFSLPQEWLWCETWCSNETKPAAKSIDLCNNPMNKRGKLDAARSIVGDAWVALDDEITSLEARELDGDEERVRRVEVTATGAQAKA